MGKNEPKVPKEQQETASSGQSGQSAEAPSTGKKWPTPAKSEEQEQLLQVGESGQREVEAASSGQKWASAGPLQVVVAEHFY